MTPPAVKIVEAEEGEEPAELCLEFDGVWMTLAEHDKVIEAKEMARERLWWWLYSLAVFVIAPVAWLFVCVIN